MAEVNIANINYLATKPPANKPPAKASPAPRPGPTPNPLRRADNRWQQAVRHTAGTRWRKGGGSRYRPHVCYSISTGAKSARRRAESTRQHASTPADWTAQLLDTGDRLTIDREQHVAAANAGTRCCSSRVLDQQAVLAVSCLRSQRSAGARRGRSLPVAASLYFPLPRLAPRFWCRPDLDVTLTTLAARPRTTWPVSRRDVGDHWWQFVRRRDLRPLTEDHVARFAGRPTATSFLDRWTPAPPGLHPERLSGDWSRFWMVIPDGRCTFPGPTI